MRDGGTQRERNGLLAYAVAYAAGCGVGTYGEPGWEAGIWMLAAAAGVSLLYAAGFVWSKMGNGKAVHALGMMLTAMALGLAAYDIRNPMKEESHYAHVLGEGEESLIVAEITSEPQRTTKKYKATAEVKGVGVGDSMMTTTGSTVFYFDTTEGGISAGTTVAAVGRFSEPLETVGDGFEYRKYLRHKGVAMVFFAKSAKPVAFNPSPRVRIEKLRQNLSATLSTSKLTPERQGVAKALMLGDRRAPTDITREEFRAAGVAHLLCVSGLHVGLVAALAGAIVRLFGNGRRARWLRRAVELTAVWLFVEMTGAAASTMRAGVMFSFIIVGKAIYERGNTLNALGLSAIALLTYRPTLIADVGFQLSYTAVWGIITFARPIGALARRKRARGYKTASLWQNVLKAAGTKTWDYVAVCLAAQVSTIPLILYHFHEISVWFLIGNVLIVPFAGVLLASVMVMLAVSRWPWGWMVMQEVVDWLLGAICSVTHWVSKLPGATVEDVRFTLPMLALSLAAIVSASLWARSFSMRAGHSK